MKVFKLILLILCGSVLTFNGYGQKCNSISKKRDKVNGIITVSGIATSNEFYHLLIQKQISMYDTLEPPHYLLFLNVPSRARFSDSTLRTKGTFNLELFNNSILHIDGVSFINRPSGLKSIAFKVYVNEEVIRALAENPIVAIVADDKLKTEFKLKRQKEQQRIFSCLLQSNPRR